MIAAYAVAAIASTDAKYSSQFLDFVCTAHSHSLSRYLSSYDLNVIAYRFFFFLLLLLVVVSLRVRIIVNE